MVCEPLLDLSSATHCIMLIVAIYIRCDIYGTCDNTLCCIVITNICEILAVFPITCDNYICKRSRKYVIEDCHTCGIERFPR